MLLPATTTRRGRSAAAPPSAKAAPSITAHLSAPGLPGLHLPRITGVLRSVWWELNPPVLHT